MKKFTSVKDLKVGDIVQIVTDPDWSLWNDNFSHIENKTFEITEDASHAYGVTAWHMIDVEDGEQYYCDDEEWPVILVEAAHQSEKEEKETSYLDSFKKIPEFNINFAYAADMMTDKQKEKVIQEAKDQARSWVLRNYASWPIGLELYHKVEGRTLKTEWKETQ